eukprot:gnl/MRDRNA2_/MRDRNA2_70517_c0_seq4.p1 gnl/MRDRNA2_/MRDRNA2_70517_c0~~gnl/MRDRNA2_/MRDRNA2_70517_c0_seq4.p1  ORF type:complete len:122 (+),score=19.39 gnl/MRDRNA2_/MRDRNA2_70517_c0_seq4:83-448(+)
MQASSLRRAVGVGARRLACWWSTGALEVLEKPIYNDGMGQWRVSPTELQERRSCDGSDTLHWKRTKDLLHMWHGQTMLPQNPGLSAIKLLPFHCASYDTKARKMAFVDPKCKHDFMSSGTN